MAVLNRPGISVVSMLCYFANILLTLAQESGIPVWYDCFELFCCGFSNGVENCKYMIHKWGSHIIWAWFN